MKHYAQLIRYALVGLSLCGTLAIGGAVRSVAAQDAAKPSAPARRGPRDPFEIYKPPVRTKKSAKTAAAAVPVPGIQERIAQYKAQKVAAMSAQQPAPKPTTALLLGEMQVMGIFRTPRGYAAMVEATPIKLSYVIYPGETFYDGQLVAIEEDRLVFRHVTRYTDGRSDKSTEYKPLRQPNAVADSMTAARGTTGAGSAPAAAPAVTSESADSKPVSSPEKQ
ncbi:MAG TPA: hypothetical protein VF723_09980 [Pyrinomonadaceae bacterium]|jgi:hypothetical protein